MKSALLISLPIISLLIIGLLEIGLAIPLILEKVPPNWIYGFRTVKTISDKKVWYTANKFASKLFLASGGMAVVLAGILWWLRRSISVYSVEIIALLGIVVPLGIVVVASFVYLNRL